ncbi:DUF3857 domain-containing protein [Gramella sp. KN1008]|uniref:DUF3857 domain-containing protein n=1 Tax=Gramella sp. KN1008 TaxID=2529298 RepID=UPI00103A9708|nr:DUF3857 domain-containing protein [Gramella sp. KN1008]TBW26796.1 DUF3857 domain-containing protein [Gramella sp. KN1008]
MRQLSILLFVLFAQNIIAQEPYYKTFDWEEKPDYEVGSQLDETIIGLKHHIVTEFFFTQDNRLTEYMLEHNILRLNSDDKIEEYNKIYLPHSSTSRLIVTKARVINPAGKVMELDESKVLTAQDEETGQQYKYFAFEGIEKGSIIDYYYVIERLPDYNGNRLNFQSGFEKKNVEFDLFAPSNLIFKFKSYNGLPEVKSVEEEGKRHWNFKAIDLAALEEEELSAYQASRGFIIYKLDQNTTSGVYDISSYSNMAQNIYNFYYKEQPRKIEKKLEKLAKAVSREGSDLEKVRKLEYLIKNEFYIAEASNEDLGDLDNILEKKVASEVGIVKLYAALLYSMGIKHELVFTTDRTNLKFDKEFEAQNFLTDVLLYFPKMDVYMSPTDIPSRIGYPPAVLTDNYGLFIKEVKVGEFKSALGEIRYIDPITSDKTVDKMAIHVEFDKKDMSTTKIDMEKSMSGYYAMYFHPFMNLIDKENRDELVENFAKSMNEDINVTKKEIVNGDPQLFGIKPLKFVINANSDAFMQKAGNRYLFNVGALIGKQIEMYQEKKRVLPLENEFTRSYFRTIDVAIPEGYEIVNLEDIVIENSYFEGDEEVFSFESGYEMEGNILKIFADEHYKRNMVDTEHFQEYRKVINSAADFNKITLVLKPKA